MKLKQEKIYTIAAPKAHDVLVLTMAKTRTKIELDAVNRELRRAYPRWEGTLIVLAPDEKLERISEVRARALYESLKIRFDAERAPL